MSKDISLNFGNGKSDKLPIKTFTFDMFVEHPSIVMIAKRGSGKSWVVRAILEYFRDIPVGLIISPTDKMSSFYGTFFPESYIHYEFKSEIIQKVMYRQGKIIDKKKDKNAHGTDIDTRCFVIMDDCLGQKGKWVNDPAIQELLFNGRHYHIMYILTMQFPLGITPQLRSNFDYIFLLADDFISNIKRMYEHYAGMFPNFDSFRQVFQQLTDDFGSMVIVNRGAKKTLFEKIYYYKAPSCDNISKKFGCQQFRDFHENNFDKNWRRKKTEINVDDMLARKKNKLFVEKIKPVDDNHSCVTQKKRRGSIF
jgi:hypothetical protein